MGEVSHEDLQSRFGECLAKADSLTSSEGGEACWDSLLTIRRQKEWTRVVESLWKVFVWPLPLVLVVLKSGHIHKEGISFPDGKATYSDIHLRMVEVEA